MVRGRQSRLALGLIVASTVVLLAVVVLSPVVMAVATRGPLDWHALSDVGQAYGGVSAVLSALAFGGIAASLLLQWRQMRIASVAAARERHFELVRLAIEDPSLMSAAEKAVFGDDARIVARSNLWVAHWLMLWELGQLSDGRLVAAACALFDDPVVRRWWSLYGSTWALSESRSDQRFVALVHKGYESAPTPAEARAGVQRRLSARALGVAVFGAGVVVSAALAWRRRRASDHR